MAGVQAALYEYKQYSARVSALEEFDVVVMASANVGRRPRLSVYLHACDSAAAFSRKVKALMQLLERSLPHNIDAEKALLGAVLVNNENFYQLIAIARPEDFYYEAHRTIMKVMVALVEVQRPIDLVSIQERLRQDNQLEAAGGIGYIASLMDGVPYLVNLEEYSRIVRDKALLRGMIAASNVMMASCFDASEDPAVLLDRAEQKMLELASRRTDGALVPLQDIATRTTEILNDLYINRRMVTGVGTGFTDLDRMTTGFQPGDLVILAARPACGKTALALNIATHVATVQQLPVAIFSLEMSRHQLYMRILCAEGMVDAHKVRTGYINQQELQKLTDTITKTSIAPIYIDDSSTQTALDIRTATRTLHRQTPLGLIVIDYLQLMSGAGSSRENRQQEVSAIVRSLKNLARELSVPILALSQLSRAAETRTGDHRPMLSDLRESGELEQASDTVIFVFREEMYKPSEENNGLAELIMAKQRNGPTGIVKLAFMKQYTKFENLLLEY